MFELAGFAAHSLTRRALRCAGRRAPTQRPLDPFDRIGLEGARRHRLDSMAERCELRDHRFEERAALDIDRVAGRDRSSAARSPPARDRWKSMHADDRLGDLRRDGRAARRADAPAGHARRARRRSSALIELRGRLPPSTRLATGRRPCSTGSKAEIGQLVVEIIAVDHQARAEAAFDGRGVADATLPARSTATKCEVPRSGCGAAGAS